MPSAADPSAVTVEIGQLSAVPFSGDNGRRSAPSFGRFFLPVIIHGQTLRLFADYGAGMTVLTDSAIDRAHLPHWFDFAKRADTIVGPVDSSSATRNGEQPEVVLTRGDSTFRYWDVSDPPTLDSLRIGTSRQDSVLLAFELSAAALAPFDGILGREFLTAFDVLFDLQSGSMRLFDRAIAPKNAVARTETLGRFRPSDCVGTRAHGIEIDTSDMSADDRRDILRNPARRLVQQRELLLPVTLNGQPFSGHFDSGAEVTFMNWAQARALGLARDDARVRPYAAGGFRLFTNTPAARQPRRPAARSYLDSTFSVVSVTLTIAGKAMPADTMLIAEPDFVDMPNHDSEPMIFVGLRAFRNRQLLLSHSTSEVCLSSGK